MSKYLSLVALAIIAVLVIVLIIPHSSYPINHVIVVLQENHTYDNYFATYPNKTAPQGMYHLNSTKPPRDLCHSWDCAHQAYHNGKMDGWNDSLAFGYYDYRDIAFYWNLAREYVLFDNYFSSVMSNSLPNHLYLVAGQSGGIKGGDRPNGTLGFVSVLNVFEERGISFKLYRWGIPCYFFPKNQMSGCPSQESEFFQDLANGTLPSVSFVEALYTEHPTQDIRQGEQSVAELVKATMESRYWQSAAFFITWDDYGGWYDHVKPPQVDGFGYGFRVPLLLVSPYARHGYVDHTLADHTSVLKFIETLFGLPSLAQRDSKANNLIEAFNF